MFVRPPAVRTRNPGRRPMQPRLPPNELNRPLLRQFVRNRRSDPRYEAYILEVREGPAVNGNTNAAAGKSMPQPWVTVRDFVQSNNSIGLPVSVCDTLLKHLLSCVASEESIHTDSSEENEPVCPSPSESAEPPQPSSPAEASGDAKSAAEEATSEDNSPKKSPFRAQAKPFELNQLKPIRIVCEATGCMLEVTSRDPTAKRTSAASGEAEPNTTQVDASRRWIVSAPLETRANSNTENNVEGSQGTSVAGRRRQPWEARGVLELHGSLMAQFSAFLADVVTRYRSVNQLPEVRSLYSASGGRRFFFDLRDTRWGKRLHISQVTDLHRNVIGIPLEALCTFRTRLDMIIRSLGLEDQHLLRSELYGPAMEAVSTGDKSRVLTSPPETGDHSVDGAHNGRKDTPVGRGDNSVILDARNRDRMPRRRRMRSFTGATTGGSGNQSSAPSRNSEGAAQSQDTNPRRYGPNGPPAGFAPQSRRFARRNRNIRPFNQSRPQPTSARSEDADQPDDSTVNKGPEPAIDAGRVAAVAEASA